MIRCIAIDDEPLALKQMANYIDKTPQLELTNSFTSAIKALDFIQNTEIDLMFLDINMPDITGIEFVKTLANPPKVIFTTAYREYAFEGFKVDAADYLVKPIAYTDFLKSVNKTKERYFTVKENESTVVDDKYLFIKSEYKILRLNYNDILYIESMSDYVRIHLNDEKPVMALMSMKKIVEHLPSHIFMRVHRSFIVNLEQIDQIERGRIIFGKEYIPISDQHKEEFNAFLDKRSIT